MMTDQRVHEREIPGTRNLTAYGVSLALLEILLTALYLYGTFGALDLMSRAKPLGAEWAAFVAVALVLLEKFAFSFLRATNPMKYYPTEEVEGEAGKV